MGRRGGFAVGAEAYRAERVHKTSVAPERPPNQIKLDLVEDISPTQPTSFEPSHGLLEPTGPSGDREVTRGVYRPVKGLLEGGAGAISPAEGRGEQPRAPFT